jgi:hypothetical protein
VSEICHFLPYREFQEGVQIEEERKKSKIVHEDLRIAVCQPHPTGSMRLGLPG